MNDKLREVENVLESEIRPKLIMHGGNVQLISIEKDIVTLKFVGACRGCPSAMETYHMLLEDTLLKALDWVKGVALADPISQDLLDQARKILKRREITHVESTL